MKRHIYQQVAYNLWASKKLIDFFKEVNVEMFELPVSNSFPTLKDTILHIYAAERTWVLRMQGKPPKIWPASSFKGELSEVFNAWEKSSRDLMTFVSSQTEEELTSSITYTSFEGLQLTNTKEQILYHVINHSTYHRGQLVTITKQLKIKNAPSTDLFYYYAEV